MKLRLGAVALLMLASTIASADAPYTATQQQSGILACSVTWAPGLPPEPLPGIPGGAGLPPRVSGTNACGFEGQVGLTELDRAELYWHIAGNLSSWSALDLRVEWIPSTAATVRLQANAYVAECVNLPPYFFGKGEGASPLTITADAATIQSVLAQGAGGGCAGGDACNPTGCNIITRVFASPTFVTAGPAGVGVALFQTYNQTLEATFQ